ncbi:SDR family oxidoreductase [Pontibacter sp. HSC-36F09]|uniref:SDR family oxidoreductase n=1 Tax=Pontibacter sp. HSC-36F09 TaxID=2910966 RepID=UPI0020A18079|nr:SDR family oxidoreductase [Pontibacter sp. HSC-36F09]MCP2045468.1 short-subunit dehydrogenase [Pontibacter sp. HSC-36F09]
MTHIRKSTVLITGGASGIGKLMGSKCLQRGASRVLVWDINPAGLQQTYQEFSEAGYEVHTWQVNIGDTAQVQQAAHDVQSRFGAPEILINNAGIVVGKPFVEHSMAEIEQTLQVNVLGAMLVTRAFLPAMVKRGSGHIVNIASAASLLPNPRMSVYAGSKWAVLGWSESLRLELEQTGPNLKVTTVMPSYIDTGMFAGVRAPLLTPILQPDAITEAILNAIEHNKILLRKPFIVNLLPLLRGILPTRVFDTVAGRWFGVYTSMNDFTGQPAADPKPAYATKP